MLGSNMWTLDPKFGAFGFGSFASAAAFVDHASANAPGDDQ
jgi:hypothetical protein